MTPEERKAARTARRAEARAVREQIFDDYQQQIADRVIRESHNDS